MLLAAASNWQQGATLRDATATWREEIAHARKHCACRDLAGTGRFMEQDVSLRWFYARMIEEYARHNGHTGLLRERIDGTTGAEQPAGQPRPLPMAVRRRDRRHDQAGED